MLCYLCTHNYAKIRVFLPSIHLLKQEHGLTMIIRMFVYFGIWVTCILCFTVPRIMIIDDDGDDDSI